MVGGRGAAALTVLLLALIVPSLATGAELLARGQVVDVVPLHGRDAAPGTGCPATVSPRRDDLASLLAWDIGGGCRPARDESVVSGYRVYYRWDGRTYSRVMAERPGSTVAVRVHLD